MSNREWNFVLMKVPAAGGEPQQLTQRAGVNGGFEGTNVRGTFRWSPDGRSIVYTFMDHARTSDLWMIPAEGGTPRQLTNHMPDALKEDRFAAPELVRYPSVPGIEIPAFLYKPRNMNSSARAPLLLYSHSFGSGMHVNGFYPFIQYFVSRGYVVLSPQVRGSAGLGRDFERANDGDWGGGDIDDTAAAVDYLDGLGLIDRSRVAMQGGSTGGYRVMQTAVRYPDLLKAGVNLYGPTNLVGLYDFYLPSRKPILMRVVGGQRGNPSMAPGHWRERSATFNIDRVKTPLMLYWADRDQGVPTSQADEYLRLARERGHGVEYVVTDNESHGWYTWRPATLETALERIEAFYEQHVGQ